MTVLPGAQTIKPLHKAEIIHLRPKPKKRKRKGPHEPRAMSRAHKVKDGRPLLLGFQDPRNAGSYVIHEGYFDTVSGKWWLANTSPDLPGCDAAEDLFGTPVFWLPMPQIQSSGDDDRPDDSLRAENISDKKASKKQPSRRRSSRKGEAPQRIPPRCGFAPASA